MEASSRRQFLLMANCYRYVADLGGVLDNQTFAWGSTMYQGSPSQRDLLATLYVGKERGNVVGKSE